MSSTSTIYTGLLGFSAWWKTIFPRVQRRIAGYSSFGIAVSLSVSGCLKLNQSVFRDSMAQVLIVPQLRANRSVHVITLLPLILRKSFSV